jgi:hypothetical protein
MFRFDLESLRRQYGFTDWPNGLARINLGERSIDVIPTPGHNETEVSFCDGSTGFFFSGDFLMPGRLLVDDGNAYLNQRKRVAALRQRSPSQFRPGRSHRNGYRWQDVSLAIAISSSRTCPRDDETESARAGSGGQQLQWLLQQEGRVHPDEPGTHTLLPGRLDWIGTDRTRADAGSIYGVAARISSELRLTGAHKRSAGSLCEYFYRFLRVRFCLFMILGKYCGGHQSTSLRRRIPSRISASFIRE